MLGVRGLASGYGRIPILTDIGMAVAAKESVGILGHNGMGKTTLLRTLVGQLPATAGRIELDGSDITRLPSHRRARLGLGYVPQGREIFPALTALDNLRMATAGAGVDDRILEEVLEDFPRLQPLLDRPGGVLSGGEQQILALARCLCAQPKLVLLDEPTEGIQPSIIDEIAELLHAQRHKRGLAIVLVEQNLEFIRRLSDRVLIIQKGRITGQLAPNDLGDEDLVAEFIGMSR